MIARAPHGLERRHALKGVLAGDVEDDGVPGGRRDRVAVATQAFASEVRTRVGRSELASPGHLIRGREALEPTRGLKSQCEPTCGTDVGVLQVHELKARTPPVETVATAVPLKQRQFGTPVHAVGCEPRIFGKVGKHAVPALQDVGGLRVDARHGLLLGQVGCRLEIDALDLQSGEPTPVTQREAVRQRRVMRDRVDLLDRIGEHEIVVHRPCLDQRKNERGAAHFEVGGRLRQIRVTDDDVQPAMPLGIGVRLVAGIDDGPLQRGLEPHFDLEEVCALR